ncbi:MAG: hypothetical protein ACRD03_15910 [Acidimicrobiales bacterium]
MSRVARFQRRAVALAGLALVVAGCTPTGPTPSAPSPASTTTTIPLSSTTSTTRAPGLTTTSSTSVATTGGGSRGLPATDRLERDHRLAQALPHWTPHYSIDFSVGTDGRLALRVTLLVVLNNPRDMATYQAQLRQYKAEALEFIRAQGDDPATYTVAFLPPEAGAL